MFKSTYINFLKSSLLFIFIITSSVYFTGFKHKEKFNKISQSFLRDSCIVNLNRISFSFDNKGYIVTDYTRATYDSVEFLFGAGFLLGGYIKPNTPDEELFVNGAARPLRISDYLPGKVGMDANDPRAKIYIVKREEPPFSISWEEWRKAVELGADFYDGDNDGIYNPVDKNSNGEWDYDEDRPNLIGDFTAWCVYNDAVPHEKRRFFNIKPLGIEIHQTIWHYGSISSLSNSIFIRYRIIFKGNSNYPDVTKLDSVIFSHYNDFDLGEYNDDLLGTDTLLSSVYIYKSGSDTKFGINPPSVFHHLLQGPNVFIPGISYQDLNNNGVFDEGDTPITSAKVFINEFTTKIINGAINLGLTSTNLRTPYYEEELPLAFYNIMNGYERNGTRRNPCTFSYGVVRGGVDCAQVNPFFMFSGDPLTQRGWINNLGHDVGTYLNTGKFTLHKDEPVDIIVAYAIGRGENALNSISVAREETMISKLFYDRNFVAFKDFPKTELKARTFENKIDLFWKSYKDFNYRTYVMSLNGDILLDIEFEGYELWAHRTPVANYSDRNNSIKIASFDVENEIDNLYYYDVDGISVIKYLSEGIQLNPLDYGTNPDRIIMFSLDKNPFTGKPLFKGERLFFTLKKIFIDKSPIALAPIPSRSGNFIIKVFKDLGIKETFSSLLEVTVGEDFNQPYFTDLNTEPGSKNITDAKVFFEEIDNSKLTDDLYQISFYRDINQANYSLFWRLKNLTKNQTVLDSQKLYYNLNKRLIEVDGLSPKIEWIEPQIIDIVYQPEQNKWFKEFYYNKSGVFFVGKEIIGNKYGNQIQPLPNDLENGRSTISKYDDLRKIEIRFGQTQYAYRFVSNSLGTRYFSGAITANDMTVGYPGQYFMEVPFQVWVKDERYKEERQLACAFLEKKLSGGDPDGEWDPGTDLNATNEYIVIFNQSYDPQGKQMEYVGYLPQTGTKFYADLSGWNPPSDANFTSEQIARAQSPWFDALLVIGLERLSTNPDSFYQDGDILTIPISYAITERDTFYYQSKSASKKLSTQEHKELLNKVIVYPNPYFEWEDTRAYRSGVITFSNLPEEVTIKIYTLSGVLIKTLTENDKTSITSPFIEWDMKNESGNRIANGVYLAHVKTKYGDKVLKFSVVKMRK